jgi:hypothetical protein
MASSIVGKSVTLPPYTEMRACAENGNDPRPSSAPLERLFHVLTKPMTPRLKRRKRAARKLEAKLKTAARKGNYCATCDILNMPPEGFDVNAARSTGSLRTPLYCAAEGGFEQIVARLLAAGANPHQPARNGLVPADIADSKGFLSVARILRVAMTTDRSEFRRPGPISGVLSSGSFDSFLDTDLYSSADEGPAESSGQSFDLSHPNANGVAAPSIDSTGLHVKQPPQSAAVGKSPRSPRATATETAAEMPSVDPLLVDSISNAYAAALKRAESISIVRIRGSAHRSSPRVPERVRRRGPPPDYNTAPRYELPPKGSIQDDLYGVVLCASEKMAQTADLSASPPLPNSLSDVYAAVINTSVDEVALAAAKQMHDDKVQKRGVHDKVAARSTVWVPSPTDDEPVEEWVPPDALGDEVADQANQTAEDMYAGLPTT